MVLADLGSKISSALRKMANQTIIDQEVFDEALKEICKALLQADVNVTQVKTLRENVKRGCDMEEMAAGLNKRKMIEQAVVDEMVKMLDADREPFQPKKKMANVIMFVGLQGCGKTTTCTKYAYHYKRKGFKTGLICADTFRAGAFDQLKQNATKAKIAFYGSYTETDPSLIAQAGVEKFKDEEYEVIIVDTSGRHKQEDSLFEEMEQVQRLTEPDDIIFVMDSSIGQAAYDQAAAFKAKVPVGSVIITKLDGHAKGGGAMSAVAATRSPIVFIGTGEHIEDFDNFEPKSFVRRLLGLGDIAGLMGKMKEVDADKQAPELLKRLTAGEWTLRDMREQFQTVLKMGPLGKILESFPGMSGMLTKGSERESANRIKRWMTIMDSMTDFELDHPKCMDTSRLLRIMQGSGRNVFEVNELLDHYNMMSTTMAKTMKQMSKGKGKGSKPQDMKNLDSQTVARMMQQMNPQMLQHIGGPAGLEKMMKEMEKEEKKYNVEEKKEKKNSKNNISN